MDTIQSFPPELSTRREAALRLAQEAGALAMRMRPPPGAARAGLKGEQDWLTEADGAVERFLSESLSREFPEDGFQGEEGGTARGGRWRWVVDPIDGTSNYARGGARWCVSLALMEGEDFLLGVLEAPAMGETHDAVRGGGARLNGEPVRAAATTRLAEAIVEVGWSPRADDQAWFALNGRVRGAGAMLRNGGSGALALADVACGRTDGYAELFINLWDCAAAMVLLAEAGAAARFPDHRGGPILAAAPGVAAALELIGPP